MYVHKYPSFAHIFFYILFTHTPTSVLLIFILLKSAHKEKIKLLKLNFFQQHISMSTTFYLIFSKTLEQICINYFQVINIRDGSVSKMCTSGGRQCKTVPIPELRVLVHPNQTWIFPLNNIAIKVPKWTKYERNLYNFFRFLVCSQYFKFSFHFMCCQARFRL